MFFSLTDSEDIFFVRASEETLLEFWNKYWTFRYDSNFTFCEFLMENGIYAKRIPPWLIPDSGTIDIEISQN